MESFDLSCSNALKQNRVSLIRSLNFSYRKLPYIIKSKATRNVDRWEESIIAKILCVLKRKPSSKSRRKRWFTNLPDVQCSVAFRQHPKRSEECRTTWSIRIDKLNEYHITHSRWSTFDAATKFSHGPLPILHQYSLSSSMAITYICFSFLSPFSA